MGLGQVHLRSFFCRKKKTDFVHFIKLKIVSLKFRPGENVRVGHFIGSDLLRCLCRSFASEVVPRVPGWTAAFALRDVVPCIRFKWLWDRAQNKFLWILTYASKSPSIFVGYPPSAAPPDLQKMWKILPQALTLWINLWHNQKALFKKISLAWIAPSFVAYWDLWVRTGPCSLRRDCWEYFQNRDLPSRWLKVKVFFI